MKRIFTYCVGLMIMLALSTQAQVRVGDPGVNFDLSDVHPNYREHVLEWVKAGVQGGIPFITEQYDTILTETNSAGLNAAIRKMAEKGGYRQIKLINGIYTIDASVTMADSVRLIGETRNAVVMNITMRSGIAFRFYSVRSGLDNMTIQGGYGVPNDFSMSNSKPDFMTTSVYFSSSCRNSWLDKVTIINSGNHAISSWRCSHITVRDCYIERSWNKGSGGRGYIQFSGDHCLMYNCVVKKMRHICIQREGCTYNVFYKNIVEQDFNFHNADAGYNLVEQNISVLPEGLGREWHSVMGPWSRIHNIPGPGNIFYRNGCVENNGSRGMTYSSDTIVYSPVDYEWRQPIVPIDTLSRITSFYPAVETNIKQELSFFNPIKHTDYFSGIAIPFLAKSVGDFECVRLMKGAQMLGQDNNFPYYFEIKSLPLGNNTLTLVGIRPDGSTLTSESVTINVTQPTLTLEGITEGQEVVPGHSVSFSGVSNGGFQKVSLYVEGSWVEDDLSAPFSFTHNFTSTGNKRVQIVGTLYSGQRVSAPTVTVNCVPLIISSPSNGSFFSTSEMVNIGTQHFGDYQKVSLYVDGSWRRTDWAAPYAYSLNDFIPGEHSLHLVGRTVSGTWRTSRAIRINIVDSDLILTSPLHNQTFDSNSTIRVASKHIGDYQKVSLYINGRWTQTDWSAPYAFAKSGLADGTYSVYLLGRKRTGQWVRSNQITITIGTPAPSARSAQLEDSSSDDETILYPNPFGNEINIVNNDKFQQAILLDVTGKTIEIKQLRGQSLTWNTSHLSKGVYFIQLKAADRMKTMKVIRK